MNDLVAALEALTRLPAVLARLEAVLDRVDAEHAAPPPDAAFVHLVTLDQIGACVRRTKKSMNRYLPQMPPPAVRGRRGHPSLWRWPEVKPWIEQTFALIMPAVFPGNAGVAERLRGERKAA